MLSFFLPLVAPRFDEVSVWFVSRGPQVRIYMNMRKLVGDAKHTSSRGYSTDQQLIM